MSTGIRTGRTDGISGDRGKRGNRGKLPRGYRNKRWIKRGRRVAWRSCAFYSRAANFMRLVSDRKRIHGRIHCCNPCLITLSGSMNKLLYPPPPPPIASARFRFVCRFSRFCTDLPLRRDVRTRAHAPAYFSAYHNSCVAVFDYAARSPESKLARKISRCDVLSVVRYNDTPFRDYSARSRGVRGRARARVHSSALIS